jgi:hypothetical protein
MKLDGGLSWRWSGPQRIISGRLGGRAPQERQVRERRRRKNRRGVQLGRITEHQSGAAQRIVIAMGIGLVFCGGVMGVPRHLVISDGWRVRRAMRVFMTAGFNRLGAHLHGPARDEDHRGQDFGQGGGEPLNHGSQHSAPAGGGKPFASGCGAGVRIPSGETRPSALCAAMTEIQAHHEKVLVIDFGSQVTQLIARRLRESGVYCEVHPFNRVDDAFLDAYAPQAIILSGGPNSVHGEGTPRAAQSVFERGLPVLGICYGEQTMCAQLGGSVEAAKNASSAAPISRSSPTARCLRALARSAISNASG